MELITLATVLPVQHFVSRRGMKMLQQTNVGKFVTLIFKGEQRAGGIPEVLFSQPNILIVLQRLEMIFPYKLIRTFVF